MTTAGSVAAIAPDGSSFTVQTTSGASVTLSTTGDQTLIQDLAVGDSVEVMYTTNGAALTARTVTITGSAAAGGG